MQVPGARVSAVRRTLADALGLGVLLLAFVHLLRPALLLAPTITAGGDTPCHYPTAAWLYERLLPEWRLHGWYPGAYLGQPLLLYYFPFPFLLMAAMAPLAGMPVAFKLGTALGAFLLPLLVYASFRLMRLAFPAPLLGAAAALVFLYVEDNPIWGGTIASTLAGEFSYTYGTGFAVLFLGVLVRARRDGWSPWWPAAALALTSYAHGYAVLWAGLTASGLLLCDPAGRALGADAAARESGPEGSQARTAAEASEVQSRRAAGRWRLLGWLVAVAALAFALAAPSLVPLLADWGWTTAYHDAWIDVTTVGLVPPLLQPLLAAGLVGIVVALARVRGGRPEARPLLLLGFGALAGTALAAAGPGLGVIDVRFVPLAQLSLSLAGAAALGWAARRMALADVVALALVVLAVVWAGSRSRVLRHWVEWNYSGLEAKELWPAWQTLTARLAGDVASPRVAVEYGPVHEQAGSIRMYETLPWFSGRSTLEGVYNQAATTTHPVYYLASELFYRSPNPFRSRLYSRFDPESALGRLRLFNVSEIVAVSPELRAALASRPGVEREAEIPPYTVFRLTDPGPGYVEPLAFAPVRAEPSEWRDASYRWFSRKPPNRALLVFTRDPRFELTLPDPWAPPPERPLPGGVAVTEEVAAEELRIHTSRPGHPLLVKISYHPRWRAEGADGPFLVSPGLMLIVPREPDVRLFYEARGWPDRLGRSLFLAALVAGLVLARHRRLRADAHRSSVDGSDRLAERAGREGGSQAAAGEGSGAPSADWRYRSTLGAVAGGGPGEPIRWRRAVAVGGFAVRILPLALVAGLAALRLAPEPQPAGNVSWLDEQASRAFAEERWDAAAEYARHAVDLLASDDARRSALSCLRGEALLRDGQPRLAALAFAPVVDAGSGPYRPQALFSGALAREASGDPEGAAAWRRSLLAEHPKTPWAERLAR